MQIYASNMISFCRNHSKGINIRYLFTNENYDDIDSY